MKSLGIGLTQTFWKYLQGKGDRGVCERASPLSQGNAYSGGEGLCEVSIPMVEG